MPAPGGVAPLLLLGSLLTSLCSMPAKKKEEGQRAPAAKKSKAAPKGQGLDKQEADKMRAWLKYQSEKKDGSGKPTSTAESARAAQALWNGMKDPTDRKRFLQTFASDKDKTLDWLATFEENCTNEEVHTRSAKKGYRNVSQALALKDLTIKDFADIKEATAFVQEWWEENSEEHGTKEEFPIKEDAKDRPLWKQWYFVERNMDDDQLVTKDSRTFKGTSNLKNMKQLEAAGSRMAELPSSSASGSGGGGEVKIENPHWPEIVSKKDEIARRPRQPPPALPSLVLCQTPPRGGPSPPPRPRRPSWRGWR